MDGRKKLGDASSFVSRFKVARTILIIKIGHHSILVVVVKQVHGRGF